MFREHEQEIATEANEKGLKSDDVLAVSGARSIGGRNVGQMLPAGAATE